MYKGTCCEVNTVGILILEIIFSPLPADYESAVVKSHRIGLAIMCRERG